MQKETIPAAKELGCPYGPRKNLNLTRDNVKIVNIIKNNKI